MKEDLLRDPVFGMAAEQFDRVADFLELDQRVRERCKWPKRLITVSLPVTMDDVDVALKRSFDNVFKTI